MTNRNAARAANHALWVGITLGYLVLSAPAPAEEPKPRLTLTGHTGIVECVAISPDGKTLASGGGDNTIRLWDTATGKEQAVWKKAAIFWVHSLAFSPDGKTLASGSGGNHIKLWDVATGKATILYDKLSEYATPRVLFSADGKALVSGGQCIREIRVWDVAAGKETAKLPGHDAYGVKAMSLSADGKTLTTIGHDAKMKVWDLATGKETVTLKTGEWTPAAAFGPDGKTLAVSVYVVESIQNKNVVTDNSVKLLEVATGKTLASLKGHSSEASALAFSPDSKTLATGDEDGTIKIWDVAKGKELATLKGHTDHVWTLVFSPDGKALVLGSADKTIKIWDLPKLK